MNDFYKDFSSLTRLPETAIKSLVKTVSLIICDCYNENKEEPIDIGIGKITIFDENNIQFEPSADLQKKIKNCINNKGNPLVSILDNKFAEKILEIYKELL